ncbi:MAG: Fic family protein [Nanoarchaeota archaeon]|nr:Fic family protein [Nanoarchaeota archaeon]MBU0978173.1 Fic family protein [Nanoarchaeota archaeon]
MRVIKRKKGNQEYFYLQHSYKKKNKVITQEKYLGKNLPDNIDKIKESLLKESKKELNLKLEKIKDIFQKEWLRIPPSAKQRELEEIAISFTYNTNAIEGSTITLEETREIIKDEITPRKSLRDVKETESHNRLFLKMLDKKTKLSKKLILSWHKEIFRETKEDIAGKFRDYLVRVGPYLAIDWQEIEKEITKLVRFINTSNLNPVELSARAHYRFEKIHPFGDGNGRIGRLLMNQILWRRSYPMLIIEYAKRRSYYKALTKDEDSFVNYFLRRYLAVHKRRLA